MNRIEQALQKSNGNIQKKDNTAASDIELFISDSKIADAVFDDLEKDAKSFILNKLTKIMSKQVESIAKKHNVPKEARINVPNFGTAYLFSIYEQILSDNLQVVRKNKPISR